MSKILDFKRKRVDIQKIRRPIPRKKMVEATVYDCPECGTELQKPKDPDIRVTLFFECPNCGYCF